MSHQPFENWILDEPPVTPDEKQELAKHINECPECGHLVEGWKSVQHSIRVSEMYSAPADFTAKWSENLARRKREQEKRQARILITSLCSGAGALLIALVILYLPEFSLISLAAGFISTLFAVINGIGNFWSITFKLIQTVPTTTLIVTIAIVSGWVLLASFTLGLSIWKLAFRRKVQNEKDR